MPKQNDQPQQEVQIQVIYPLDRYLQKSGNVQEHLTIVVQKIRQAFKSQFQKVFKELGIKLIQTKSVSKQKIGNFKQKSGILFQISCALKKLPIIYFSIQKLFNQKSVTFFSLDNVMENTNLQSARQRLQAQNMDLIMINSITVGVINYSTKRDSLIAQLKSILTTTSHIISVQQFDQQQIKILIQDNQQIRQYVKSKGFNYKYQKVDDESFSINCDKQNYHEFVYLAKKYLAQNKKQESPIQQLQTQFQIFTFLNYYSEYLKNQFPTIVFCQKQGKLYRKNRALQQDQIFASIKEKKKEMYKKVIKIPSITKIQDKKVEVCQNTLFCEQFLIKNRKYILLKKISLNVKSIYSLNELQENVVFIVSSKDKCHYFKMLLQENSYNIKNYFNSENSKKYKGIYQFKLQKSLFFNSILMCSIQKDTRGNTDQNKSISNISQIIQKFINQKRINFVFPSDANHQIILMFMTMLKTVLGHQKRERLKQINFLIQSDKEDQYNKNYQMITKTLQAQPEKLGLTKQCKFYLSKNELQKIFFLQFVQVKYSNPNLKNISTFSLSSLNSFLLNHTIRLNKNCKDIINIPVSLVQRQEYQYQYIVNIKNGVYHKLDIFCKIQEGNINQSETLKKIIQTIKKYFQNITYFIVYQNQTGNFITNKLYIYSTGQKELMKLKKVSFTQDLSKIKNCNGTDVNDKQIIFTITPKRHLNVYQIHTHRQFQEGIKRQIVNSKK